MKNQKNYCLLFFLLLISVNLTFFSIALDLKQILIKDGVVKQVLFSSKHNIKQVLIELIKAEKKSIKIAAFLLTDKQIANALIYAKKDHKIDVELVIDLCSVKNYHGKVWLLKNKDVKIFVFDGNKKKQKHKIGKSDFIPIMHNKFLIFGQNFDDRSFVCTGSFNLTYSAQVFNQENMVFFEDKNIVDSFRQEFEDLKKRTEDIENYKQPVNDVTKKCIENKIWQSNFNEKVKNFFK